MKPDNTVEIIIFCGLVVVIIIGRFLGIRAMMKQTEAFFWPVIHIVWIDVP